MGGDDTCKISWLISKHRFLLGVCSARAENKFLAERNSHKYPHAVCKHIEGGMDQVLFKRCIKEKADKIMHDDKSEELQLWMVKVKWIDNKMRSYCEDTV